MDLGEIETGLEILGASELIKDSVWRILAPTADYVGAGILSGTKASVNFARVLVNAIKRLDGNEGSGGKIPPRLMRAILDEAPFCDDELSAEYIGGVLASSWNGRSRDDRGVALMATIQRFSTYSIRTHYVCYSTYDRLCRISRAHPLWLNTAIFIRWKEYSAAMDFAADESPWEACSHCVVALEREELADLPVEGAAKYFQRMNGVQLHKDGLGNRGVAWMRKHGGLIFRPTVIGLELFLWAHGCPGYTYANDMLGEAYDEVFSSIIPNMPNKMKIMKFNEVISPRSNQFEAGCAGSV